MESGYFKTAHTGFEPVPPEGCSLCYLCGSRDEMDEQIQWIKVCHVNLSLKLGFTAL